MTWLACVPFCAVQPRADREGAVGVVDEARVGAAQVDDRDVAQVVGPS